MRMPRGYHPADKDGERPHAALLHVGSFDAERRVAVLERAPLQSETRPDPLLFRTRNPRDPPRAI
ncbi:MAG: hypothetical protein HC868_15055 [Sphingomonadales bacterium]|nr:hypothetical protein [Sphingomonadales bacterium]